MLKREIKMTEKTEAKKPDLIYVTRGAYSWGQGKTAMESFVNCLGHGSSLRRFKIIKLPEGAKDLRIDDCFGTVMWSGSKEPAEEIPFDADFLDQIKDKLASMLGDACSMMELLKDLDEEGHGYPVEDLNEITESLYDFQVTKMKETG